MFRLFAANVSVTRVLELLIVVMDLLCIVDLEENIDFSMDLRFGIGYYRTQI